MTRASEALALLIAASLSLGGDCGGCPALPPQPEPMTELRARELDPTLVEGVAVSTSYLAGDCSPKPQAISECGTADPDPYCTEGRAALRVLLLPVNVSVPRAPECEGGFAVADLTAVAVLDQRSSDAGELTAHLVAGRYAIYVSQDDRCAACALADAGTACLVEVPKGGILARDLVLDEATH